MLSRRWDTPSHPTDVGLGHETWYGYWNMKQTWDTSSSELKSLEFCPLSWEEHAASDFSCSLGPGMRSHEKQPKEAEPRQQNHSQSQPSCVMSKEIHICFCHPLKIWNCLLQQQKLIHTLSLPVIFLPQDSNHTGIFYISHRIHYIQLQQH